MGIAEFVYTMICHPPWIRSLVNRAILAILPVSVRVGDAIVKINPRDPVVSGALFFDVYERMEIALMRRLCKPGDTMIDVGANVGLYTAIAGLAVGPAGRVLAFEPEPESFSFLQKTVAANKLTNTLLSQLAASNENCQMQLFTSSANCGDHRMYSNSNADGCTVVRTVRLDDFLQVEKVTEVDVIKIDVQGFEGHVIYGMEQTIRRSPRVCILMEFWPEGLRLAGTDPAELLQRVENMGLTLHEIGSHGEVERVSDANSLVTRLQGREYTNLLLLGAQAKWTT